MALRLSATACDAFSSSSYYTDTRFGRGIRGRDSVMARSAGLGKHAGDDLIFG
jgi:hypothetical protein